jgi:hypothetical protein
MLAAGRFTDEIVDYAYGCPFHCTWMGILTVQKLTCSTALYFIQCNYTIKLWVVLNKYNYSSNKPFYNYIRPVNQYSTRKLSCFIFEGLYKFLNKVTSSLYVQVMTVIVKHLYYLPFQSAAFRVTHLRGNQWDQGNIMLL